MNEQEIKGNPKIYDKSILEKLSISRNKLDSILSNLKNNYDPSHSRFQETILNRKCYWKITNAFKRISKVYYDPSFIDNFDDPNLKIEVLYDHVIAPELEIEDGCNDTGSNNETIEFSTLSNQNGIIYENDLNIDGFYGIMKMLKEKKLATYLVIGDSKSPSNPLFCRDNFPIAGWKRELFVRIRGKTQGKTDVYYIEPINNKRIRRRADMLSYIQRNLYPLDVVDLFPFKSVYCVCHSPESSSRDYIECSFGKAGCGGWVHPECVGLENKSSEELEYFSKVLCPLCTCYLKEINQLGRYTSQGIMPLTEIRESVSQVEEKIRDFQISNLKYSSEIDCTDVPHEIWGDTSNDSNDYYISHIKKSFEKSIFEAAVHILENTCHGKDSVQLGDNLILELDLKNEVRVETSQDMHFHFPRKRIFNTLKEDNMRDVVLSNRLSHQKEKRMKLHENATILDDSLPESIAQHQLLQNFMNVSSDSEDEQNEKQSNATTSESNFFEINNEVTSTSSQKPSRPIFEKKETYQSKSSNTNLSKNAALNLDRDSVEIKDHIESQNEWEIIPEYPEEVDSRDRNRKVMLANGEIVTLKVVGGWSRFFNESNEDLTNKSRIFTKIKQNFKGNFPYSSNVKLDLNEVNYSLIPSKESSHRAYFRRMFSDRKLPNEENQSNMNDRVSKQASNTNEMRTGIEAKFDMISPYIFFVPSLDGEIKTSCLSFINPTFSLHNFCQELNVCGVCFDPRQIENPKKRKSCREGLEKFERDFGCLSYSIHKQCNYFIDSLSFDCPSGVEISSVYNYEDIDDAACDLCGRRGGCMFYFTISSSSCLIPPPSNEGWLAHAPCINYLYVNHSLDVVISIDKSNKDLLINILGSNINASDNDESVYQENKNKIQSKRHYEEVLSVVMSILDVVQSASELLQNDQVEGLQKNKLEQYFKLQSSHLENENETLDKLGYDGKDLHVSNFDLNLNKWRCSLCGLQLGLCVNCASPECLLRAHPLCIQLHQQYYLELKNYRSTELEYRNYIFQTWTQNSLKNNYQSLSTPFYLCPVHSIEVKEQ